MLTPILLGIISASLFLFIAFRGTNSNDTLDAPFKCYLSLCIGMGGFVLGLIIAKSLPIETTTYESKKFGVTQKRILEVAQYNDALDVDINYGYENVPRVEIKKIKLDNTSWMNRFSLPKLGETEEEYDIYIKHPSMKRSDSCSQ